MPSKPNNRPTGRRTHRPDAPFVTLGVSAQEVLPLAELRRRLRWGNKSVAEAQRNGLRLVRFGKQKFAIGSDVLAFFSRIADHPTNHETE